MAVRVRHLTAAMAAGAVLWAAPAPAQMDAHKIEQLESQQALRQGRAFAIGVGARLPVAIVGIQEIRNPDGRARFAVSVKNLSQEPVPSYAVSAGVVNSTGEVKAWQRLDAIRNLKPGQTRRQEFVIRVAVPAHTDLVALAVTEVAPVSGEPWKAEPPALEEAVQKAVAASSQQ
jgi:hypothetical protein